MFGALLDGSYRFFLLLRMRKVPINPKIAMTIPPINSHMALLVGAPVKN